MRASVLSPRPIESVRASLLWSLIKETDRFVPERGASITHTDTSLFEYNGGSVAWFDELEQVRYLLTNSHQIRHLGLGARMRRILLLPRIPALPTREHGEYRDLVRAVIHGQLYEGVELGVGFFEPETAKRKFNLTMARVRHHSEAWLSPEYYGNQTDPIAKPASNRDTHETARRLNELEGQVTWLTGYRDEHFAAGSRCAMPLSWRSVLHGLYPVICTRCNDNPVAQIDHGDPLRPEENPYLPFTDGNSVFFNLEPLCERCNRQKSNRLEKDWPRPTPFITDSRVLHYFNLSLNKHPSELPHTLPDSLTIRLAKSRLGRRLTY